MNSNKASTSNTLKFFKPNNPSRISARSVAGKRVVFFVLLAVLVLGFSVKVSFAATIPGPTPVPGQPLPDAWIEAKKNYTGTYQSNLNSWTSNNITPTSPNDYRIMLEYYGGYSTSGINKAGIANASSLVSDPTQNSTFLSIFGTTDESVLADWKAGRDAPTPSTSQTFSNNLVGGARYVQDAVPKYIDQAALKVVITVLGVLATFCKTLLMWSGQALDVTLNPSLYNFTSNQMVVGGWIIVRDVCNLFFLLVLLFIAICTILKIEKYHAKKTLLMLIIMALLINFSKPIAVFIFDGSQLLMNMFLSEITKNGSSPSAVLAGDIAQFLYGDLMANLASQSNSWMIAVYYLFVVVFLFMFAVALFVMFLFMMIRIVAVMILVIVSPLAFFAAIVPDFSKMSSQWWSSLFEYCYYGPAAAFFLFLATKFAISNKNSNFLPQVNIQGDEQLVIQHIIRYVVVLVFLYASIFMAKKFGGGAGTAIVGNANRFMKWAGKGVAMAPYRATAGLSRATGVSGAVSQRLQQSKYGRLLTKEGRKEAQEDQEAKMAEKFGVKGAMERQIQKKAKKYKDEHYTEEALKIMAAKGDAAAAFLLSENGDMDTATYAALQNNRNYTGNVKKMVDKKLKKKQMHIFVDGQLDNFITEQKSKTIPITYASRDLARQAFADQEFGKLSPIDVKEQDIEAIAREPVFVQALRNAYASNIPNQTKILEGMSANKYAAGQAAHIW